MVYDQAKQKEAIEQSTNRDFRTKYTGQPFGSLPWDIHSGALKAWLKANTILGPIKTPTAIREAVRRLETVLGDPNPYRFKKSSKGFARISTVRLKKGSFTSGPARKTSYKMTERYDYTSQNRHHNPFVSAACAEIVWEFLEATGYGSFVNMILDETDDRLYAHVDWYPNRTYQAETWHKDTRGYTLFVGLIYMNKTEIQGPDIIPNPWPLSDELEKNRQPKCMLPSLIKDVIDEILEENRSSKMRVTQTGKIPEGGGMVSFIDELIHHRTPQSHPKLEMDHLNMAISEKTLGRLSRGDLEVNGEWIGDFDKSAPRSFVRVWVAFGEPSLGDL